MTTIFSQCALCRHLEEGYRCPAFPDGIPTPVLLNKRDHRIPLRGEEASILWEPAELGIQHPRAGVEPRSRAAKPEKKPKTRLSRVYRYYG